MRFFIVLGLYFLLTTAYSFHLKRVLIVGPANLCFQWQREMKDKFREVFEVIRGDVLRANYGSNPWQEKNQVITSVSWVSRIEDANESLLRSEWDLIIVDPPPLARRLLRRAHGRRGYLARLCRLRSSPREARHAPPGVRDREPLARHAVAELQQCISHFGDHGVDHVFVAAWIRLAEEHVSELVNPYPCHVPVISH